MNFRIRIKSTGKQDIKLNLHDAVITVQARECSDLLKVKCIVRPDYWLEVRSNIISQSGVQLTKATILQADTVKDPNDWLTRPDVQVGKYFKRQADSQRVHNRRHYTKKGNRK